MIEMGDEREGTPNQRDKVTKGMEVRKFRVYWTQREYG